MKEAGSRLLGEWMTVDAAPVRVSAQNTPIPYNHALEKSVIPDANSIVEAVRRMFGV